MTRTCGSRLAALLVALALALAPGGSRAAGDAGLRLVMFGEEFCAYCERWEEEIGVVYERTAEGRTAPLERVSLGDPVGARLAAPVRYAPTFVLLGADRAELGRITGYQGDHFFWGQLQELLRRSANRGPGARRP